MADIVSESPAARPRPIWHSGACGPRARSAPPPDAICSACSLPRAGLPLPGLAARRASALSRSRPGGCRRRRARRPAGSSGGTTSAQRSIAYGQRVRKTQPEGGASGDGSSPESALRAARASAASPRAASMRGVLASSARVYGWRGAANSAAFGARSIDAAEVHHQHLVGDQLDDREVVRDEDVGDAGLVLQVHQQVQHLRLDRDVERRDRLVGDDDARLEHQRARDRDALALAAREHVRIARVVLGPQADARQHRAARARSRSARLERGVDRQRLLERVADLLARVEARERVLEHHLHLLPQRVAASPRRRCVDVGAVDAAARPRSAPRSSSSWRASVLLPQPDSPTTASVRPARERERDAVERAHAAACGLRKPVDTA